MSNNSGFAATMYECNPAVAALNTVPGFDPLKLMGRRRMPGAEREERYLDFRYKKLWFRLAHKKGRIRLNKLSVTEQFAMIEAQVFLELTDAVPVSSFTAVCSREEDGDRYVESAQIRAMDQALTDAGFGLQFVPAPVESAGDAVAQQTAVAPQQSTATQAAMQQQPAVPQKPEAQAVVQQRAAVLQQTAVPQKPTATQAAIQQQSAVPQKPATQTTVRQSAPQQVTAQQRPATQAVQQNPVMQQSVVQQRPAVQKPTPQQTPAAAQPVARQQPVTQQAAVQQRPIQQTVQQTPQQQRPAAVQQPATQQSAAPARPAQTAQGIPVQKGTVRPAQSAAGVQKAAVDPAASVSPQKAAPAAAAPQPTAGLPAGAEPLSADQLPVAAEEQTLPVTSDMAAAMSMLSGKGASDILPVMPESAKTEEKAEAVPEELPVAPTAVTAAPAVMGTAVPVETVSTAADVSAADAGADQATGAGKTYTETTPVDQILQFMTLEDAKKVVVPTGTCKGWTLDEVAQRRRPSLRFYLSEGYQGKDNILRAAASLVLDDLEKKAG